MKWHMFHGSNIVTLLAISSSDPLEGHFTRSDSSQPSQLQRSDTMADNQASSATPSASTTDTTKAHAPPQPADAEDSDPDFDDLDGV